MEKRLSNDTRLSKQMVVSIFGCRQRRSSAELQFCRIAGLGPGFRLGLFQCFGHAAAENRRFPGFADALQHGGIVTADFFVAVGIGVDVLLQNLQPFS